MWRERVWLLTEAGDLYLHALQETGKLGGGFELGYRIELLERRREGVREAPQCARFKLRVRRPVQVVHTPCYMLWRVQFVLNERPVYNQLGRRTWSVAVLATSRPAGASVRNSSACGRRRPRWHRSMRSSWSVLPRAVENHR